MIITYKGKEYDFGRAEGICEGYNDALLKYCPSGRGWIVYGIEVGKSAYEWNHNLLGVQDGDYGAITIIREQESVRINRSKQ